MKTKNKPHDAEKPTCDIYDQVEMLKFFERECKKVGIKFGLIKKNEKNS